MDWSVVALADSARAVVAYHDYKWQGLVQLQGVGADGLYFTADDTKGAVANTYGHYFSEERRIDFETGHYLEEGMTRFYDAVNGRKLQSSRDMWLFSPWGLRYNLNVQDTVITMLPMDRLRDSWIKYKQTKRGGSVSAKDAFASATLLYGYTTTNISFKLTSKVENDGCNCVIKSISFDLVNNTRLPHSTFEVFDLGVLSP